MRLQSGGLHLKTNRYKQEDISPRNTDILETVSDKKEL